MLSLISAENGYEPVEYQIIYENQESIIIALNFNAVGQDFIDAFNNDELTHIRTNKSGGNDRACPILRIDARPSFEDDQILKDGWGIFVVRLES